MRILDKFRENPNQFQEAALSVVTGTFLCSVILVALTGKGAFIALYLVALVAYLILRPFFWKCPKCKKLLPGSSEKINVCPYCGYPIEEKED